MNAVITELVVDARGAETGTAAYVRAMQVAQAAVDRLLDREAALRDSQGTTGASMVGVSTSTARAAAAYDKLKASIDPVFASAKALERDVLTLDRAVTRLGISEAEAGRMLDSIVLKHDAVAAAARRQANEYNRLAAAGREQLAMDRSSQSGQAMWNAYAGVRDPNIDARSSGAVFAAELDRMDQIASQKAQQIAGNFSADLNSRLITGTGKAARDAAGVFSTELDRLDDIARMRATEAGSAFASDLNARLGIGSTIPSARGSASVFIEGEREAEAYQRRLASVREEIDPLTAAIERQQTELAELTVMMQRGDLSTEQFATAQRIAQNRVAELQFQLEHAGRNRQLGGNVMSSINSAQQVQDILITSMMGQSIGTIALQQGTQLGSAAMMSGAGGGPVGMLNALRSSVAALANPVMIGAVAFTALTAGAVQYFASGEQGADKLTDSLEKHLKAIDNLEKGWSRVGNTVRGAGGQSQAVLAFQSQQAIENLRKVVGDGLSSRDLVRDFTESSLFSGRADVTGTGRSVSAQFFDVGLEGPVLRLIEGVVAGYPDLVRFNDELATMGQDPSASDALKTRIAEVLELTRAIGEAQRAVQQYERNVGPGGLLRGGSEFNRRDMDAYEAWRREEERALRQNRRSFDADVHGINARSPSERAEVARARERAKINEGESGNMRRDRIEIAGALELARAEKELTDAREQRTRAHDQTIEQQRLEFNLIGLTVGEIEALRMEYELTAQVREAAAQAGVQADEAELEMIRKKSEEFGRYAELIARTNLFTEMRFERDQMFRTPQDAAIAGRLRGAGLPVDLNGDLASGLREMNRFAEAKDMFDGFLGSFKSALMNNGGDIGEALGEAILNSLIKSVDEQWSRIFDRLATMFASWLTGSMPMSTAGFPAAPFSANTTASAFFGANDNMAADLAGMGLFNFVPGGNSGGALGMSAYRDAIAAIESRGSGDYGAIGPRHPKYGRALGRYQVMETNVGPWSSAALGRRIGADEFLANPGFQDRIFDHRFGGYVQRYGNPQDAASMWFTGRPQSQGANARDVLGTTGAGYVEKFNAELARLGETAGSATNGLSGFANNLTQVGQNLTNPSGPLGGLLGGGFQPNTTFTSFLGYTPQASMGGGGGFGGGLLSMLFGFLPKLFGFADGTDGAPPGWAWVGERGPELMRFRGGEQVVPNHRLQTPANQNTFAPVFNVDARGSTMTRGEFENIARNAVGQYHEALAQGGLGSLQDRYKRQKG